MWEDSPCDLEPRSICQTFIVYPMSSIVAFLSLPPCGGSMVSMPATFKMLIYQEKKQNNINLF